MRDESNDQVINPEGEDDLIKTSGAKHATKSMRKLMKKSGSKKTELESPYKRYKITTTLKPIGIEVCSLFENQETSADKSKYYS